MKDKPIEPWTMPEDAGNKLAAEMKAEIEKLVVEKLIYHVAGSKAR